MLVKVGVNLNDFEKSMSKMNKDLSRFGNKMQKMGTQLATSFGASGLAIAAGLGYAVNKAADFEAQMSRVGAIAGATGTDLDAMRKSALDLGAATSKSASEAAIGMENLAAMGFQANEVIAAMPGVISAAEASGSDMALVADTMAVALRTFGLEASESTRVADILAKTANTSAADMEGMALVLKYAAGPADTLGWSLEQLAASAAIMADAGIRGETAGTTLRGGLLALASPSKEATKALDNLSVKITDAQGNMLPFTDIIGQMKTGMEGMGNAQKAAALEAIFGREAVSGMMAVIDAGPEKLKALTVELQNSGGASAEAAAKMKDNLKGALEQLSGAFETMSITIGNALTPVIQSLAVALQSVADWFNQLDPATQEFVALGAAAAAVVLTLVGVFGVLLTFVGMAASGIGALGLSFATVLPVIGVVALAIGALVAVGVLLYKNWDEISEYASIVWNGIVEFIKPAIDEISSFITGKISELSTWWKGIWPDMQKAFENIWSAIAAYIKPVLEGIKAAFFAIWPYIKQLTESTWNGIKGVIEGALNIIKGLVSIFVGVFTGDWSRMWEGIKLVASGAWEVIKSIFTTGVENIKTLVTGLIVALGAYFTAFATSMFEYGENIVQGLWDGISSLAGWIKDRVTEFVESIGSTIKDFFGIASPSKLTTEYGEYVAEGLAVGIANKTGEAVAKAQAMAQAVVGVVQGAMSAIGGMVGSSSPFTDWGPSNPDPFGNDIPINNGGGGGNEKNYGSGDFQDKEGSFQTPTSDFFDDWHDDLAGLATGGRVTKSGAVMVGEKGPELLNLPQGAEVTSNKDLGKLGGGTYNINFQVNMNEIDDVYKLIELFKRLPQVARQY